MMFDLRDGFVDDFTMDIDGEGLPIPAFNYAYSTSKLDDPQEYFSNFLLQDDDQPLNLNHTVNGYTSSSSSGTEDHLMNDNSSTDWENSSQDSSSSSPQPRRVSKTIEHKHSSSKSRDLRRRVLDKRQRHLELEKVRRQDMNQKYCELQELCNSEKADKASILESAISVIEQHNSRVDSILSALSPFSLPVPTGNSTYFNC
jgi:hypothetical protein